MYVTLNFSIRLFETGFKMLNGVYFIVIALLEAEFFKILIYANYFTVDVTLWIPNYLKPQKNGISLKTFSVQN